MKREGRGTEREMKRERRETGKTGGGEGVVRDSAVGQPYLIINDGRHSQYRLGAGDTEHGRGYRDRHANRTGAVQRHRGQAVCNVRGGEGGVGQGAGGTRRNSPKTDEKGKRNIKLKALKYRSPESKTAIHTRWRHKRK